jgi:hypothetical protein
MSPEEAGMPREPRIIIETSRAGVGRIIIAAAPEERGIGIGLLGQLLPVIRELDRAAQVPARPPEPRAS